MTSGMSAAQEAASRITTVRKQWGVFMANQAATAKTAAIWAAVTSGVVLLLVGSVFAEFRGHARESDLVVLERSFEAHISEANAAWLLQAEFRGRVSEALKLEPMPTISSR